MSDISKTKYEELTEIIKATKTLNEDMPFVLVDGHSPFSNAVFELCQAIYDSV